MLTGYGAPQFLLRPLPVAEVSCVSAWLRGGGTRCVMSGRWSSIVGCLALYSVWLKQVTRDVTVCDRQ